MRTLIGTLSVVAVLAVLATLFLVAGPLPEPFRDVDGGSAIGFAFMVYFAALISLVMGAVGWTQVREIMRSRQRYVFSASAAIVIAYVVFVSFALYSLSQATDL